MRLNSVSTVTATSVAVPSPEELVARARDLRPGLRSRTARCEDQRRIPQESLDEMIQAGLFNVLKPKHYGGYEMGWDSFCDITLEIAAGCGSTGWVYGVCGSHPLMVTNFGSDIQDEVWSTNPDAIVSSAKMISGAFKKVDGGYLGNGILAISSGSLHADWVFAHFTTIEGSKKQLSTIIPLDDVTILDTWQVMGLAGTGSHNLEMKDVFVPNSHAFVSNQTPPGFGVHDAGIYNVDYRILGTYPTATVVVGMAMGALDIFVADIKDRSSRFGAKIAKFQSLQLRIAESSAEIDSAKLVIRHNTREAMSFINKHEPVPMELRTRLYRDASYVSLLALKAIERIFYAGGAGELFLNRELQRIFKNSHAGGAQFGLNWDVQGTNYGRWALGLEGAQKTAPL
jgi:3-hydroxy-9,10-secoandrosta-1,3,5(10)-triene-9,17-dione monooxygenase